MGNQLNEFLRKIRIFFSVMNDAKTTSKEVCGSKARSLCPIKPKRLDSGFALPLFDQKTFQLSLHTTFFTAYLLAYLLCITEKKLLTRAPLFFTILTFCHMISEEICHESDQRVLELLDKRVQRHEGPHRRCFPQAL